MRFMELAKRNLKETYLDLLSLGLVIIFPPALLLVLQSIGRVDPFFTATNLAPGIVLFGFALLSLSSGMLLAKDRESAFLTRLLTAPLRANDFIIAYSLPYIPVAILQTVVVFAVAAPLGLVISGNAGIVFLILLVMSVGYIGLGMILGTVFTYKTVSSLDSSKPPDYIWRSLVSSGIHRRRNPEHNGCSSFRPRYRRSKRCYGAWGWFR